MAYETKFTLMKGQDFLFTESEVHFIIKNKSDKEKVVEITIKNGKQEKE
jgi:hypothetical protein